MLNRAGTPTKGGYRMDNDLEEFEFTEDTLSPNITLEYPVIIQFDIAESDYLYFCPKGAEFFLDEHGLQWVKFFPKNGAAKNQEHMMRTDVPGFMVIRNS